MVRKTSDRQALDDDIRRRDTKSLRGLKTLCVKDIARESIRDRVLADAKCHVVEFMVLFDEPDHRPAQSFLGIIGVSGHNQDPHGSPIRPAERISQ